MILKKLRKITFSINKMSVLYTWLDLKIYIIKIKIDDEKILRHTTMMATNIILFLFTIYLNNIVINIYLLLIFMFFSF